MSDPEYASSPGREHLDQILNALEKELQRCQKEIKLIHMGLTVDHNKITELKQMMSQARVLLDTVRESLNA